MAGPYGYDKGVGGLRVPNEIEVPIQQGVYTDKIGPHVGKKCLGDPVSLGCWYCIADNYELIPNDPLPPHVLVNSCYCDWYRVHDMIDHIKYIDNCPIYNTSCW